MKTIRALSIDISLGAMASSAFIASTLGITLGWITLIVLGFAVWVIYTIDHLIDSRKIVGKARLYRHYFHQSHFKTILFALCSIVALCIILLFKLDYRILFGGTFLLASIAFYFLSIHSVKRIKYPIKEFSGAFFYSIGIFLGPLAMVNYNITTEALFLFSMYFLLALVNLQTISFYEKKADESSNMLSFANYFGNKAILKSINFILIFYFLLLAFAYLNFNFKTIWIILLLIMGLLSFSIVTISSFFKTDEKYRIYGDMVFFLPVTLLFHDLL